MCPARGLWEKGQASCQMPGHIAGFREAFPTAASEACWLLTRRGELEVRN